MSSESWGSTPETTNPNHHLRRTGGLGQICGAGHIEPKPKTEVQERLSASAVSNLRILACVLLVEDRYPCLGFVPVFLGVDSPCFSTFCFFGGVLMVFWKDSDPWKEWLEVSPRVPRVLGVSSFGDKPSSSDSPFFAEIWVNKHVGSTLGKMAAGVGVGGWGGCSTRVPLKTK